MPAQARTLVDLGAGTGLLSRALSRRAGHVIAVEPDDRMRAVLTGGVPGVEAVRGTAEHIPLPAAAADGVYASSAWQWMDPELAVPEIARVLRDGGRFGLVWTTRETDIPWLRAANGSARHISRPGRATSPNPETRPDARLVSLPDGSPFANIETETFRYSRPMTPADIVEMLTTYSAVITAEPEFIARGRERGTAALAAQFPGADVIELPIRSYCWRADRLPR